jgi:LPS sulfotransferase NodH
MTSVDRVRSGSLAERISSCASTRYVIVFPLRSGSTLLCNDLGQAGLGTPTEHFQGVHLNSPVAGYVESVVRDQAPLFGTKVSWDQAVALMRRLADEHEVADFDLRQVFGQDVKIVRVVRKNKARQAVSAWRAASTGVWHVSRGTASNPTPLRYDRDSLIGIMKQLLAEEWLWERHLNDLGIPTLTIAYEDYISDRAGWVAEIARYIGRPLRVLPALEDHTDVMADHWTDLLERRLLDDLSAPTHPLWADLPTHSLRTYLEQSDVRRLLKRAESQLEIRDACDLGAGYGRMTPVMLEAATRVSAYERETDLVNLGRALLPDVEFCQVERLAQLPVPDGSFDFVLSFTALQSLTDKEARATAHEITRVLRRPGFALLCEETDASHRWCHPTEDRFTIGRSVEAYAAMLPSLELVLSAPRRIEPTYPRPDIGSFMLFRARQR